MADYDPTIDFAASPSQSGGFDAAVGWHKRMSKVQRDTRNGLIGATVALGLFVVSALALAAVIWSG